MTFSLSLDRMALIITTATTVFFGWLLVFEIVPAVHTHPAGAVFSGVGLITIYLLAALYRPLRYQVTHQDICISRMAFDFHIPISSVQHVRMFSPEEMKYTVRTFGVGGLFGYFGFFSNFKVGKLRLFGSRRNNTVLLTLENNQRIILTPDEPEAMMQYLSAQGIRMEDGSIQKA